MERVEIHGMVHRCGPIRTFNETTYKITWCGLPAYVLSETLTHWVLYTDTKATIKELSCLACIAEELHDGSQDQRGGEGGP